MLKPPPTEWDETTDRVEHYLYDSSGKLDPNTGTPLDDNVLVYEDPDAAGPQASALKSRYLHGAAIDQVFAEETGTGDIYWALADNQGTVRDLAEYDSIMDETNVVNHIKYDAYGNITSESNPSIDFLFAYTGREWDADADLFYYRARWYDASAGRFISEDPLGFAAGDTNIFRYLANDATNATDPSGLWSYKAHLKLLTAAFNGAFTKAQIKSMADTGRRMDVMDATLFSGFSFAHYAHFMKPPKMTKEKAFERAEAYVNFRLQDAAAYKKLADKAESIAKKARWEELYLMSLASAFHTIMDSTSPAHVDKNGWPVAYEGANIKLHSKLNFPSFSGRGVRVSWGS